MRFATLTVPIICALSAAQGIKGDKIDIGACQTACTTAVTACYTAEGLTFNTVNPGPKTPAIVKCDMTLGSCSTACAALPPTP